MRRAVESLGALTGRPRLKILQWNVLAEGLAEEGDFSRAPKDVLPWPRRFPLILEEVEAANADVVCLEELNHFQELANELTARGYAGLFHEKPNSPCEAMGFPKDGTALFWRSSRFEHVGEASRGVYVDGGGCGLSQGWVSQLLADRDTGSELLVAATHLKAKADGKSSAVRQLEVAQLKAALQGSLQAGRPKGMPALVVAGDFNDTPDSPCIQAMLKDVPPPRLLSTHRDAAGAFTTWKFRNGKDGAGESEVKRVIDYIFYASGEGSGSLRPVSRWAEPSLEDIGPGGLPCAGYPSDHLAQLVEFEWGQ